MLVVHRWHFKKHWIRRSHCGAKTPRFYPYMLMWQPEAAWHRASLCALDAVMRTTDRPTDRPRANLAADSQPQPVSEFGRFLKKPSVYFPAAYIWLSCLLSMLLPLPPYRLHIIPRSVSMSRLFLVPLPPVQHCCVSLSLLFLLLQHF